MQQALAHQPAQAPVSSVPFGTSSIEKSACTLGESEAPVTFVTPSSHQDTPDRWRQAHERAKQAGIKVYQLAPGRFAVTSAHDPAKAYEVTTAPETCTCPAAASGDTVCIHRAAVRAHLNPEPEPPAYAAYSPDMDALRFAENDLLRAQNDLSRYAERMERDGDLSERDYQGSLRAQERELDAWDRIHEAKARIAAVAPQNATVAA